MKLILSIGIAFFWMLNLQRKNRGEKLKDAVDTLRNELKTDNELYYVYQSNLAMAFYDEAAKKNLDFTDPQEGFQKLHDAANEGAKRFLDLLISQDGK